MFHLTFGAFEVLCYLVATLVAIKFGNLICDEWEEPSRATAIESPDSLPEKPIPNSETPTKPTLNLAKLKLYKLHKKSVIPVSVLPFSVPDFIKRYTLRGQKVVRLEALTEIATIVA
ncbi:MAG: hypothetical protein AAGF01_12575 [Cyanobacteria bacterium P01_G01_bin.38]